MEENNNEKDYIYLKKNIKINIDSIKLKIVGDVLLFNDNISIRKEKTNSFISISYKDITFHALNKQNKMIIICDGNKYNIVNIYLNNEEETVELFNNFCSCFNDNSDKNNIELEEDEDIDVEKKLEEWEKKMVFNENEGEDNNDLNEKEKIELKNQLGNNYEYYNFENTIDKINFK